MVAACIFSGPEQGKRKTSLKIKEVGVNTGSLSQARTVIRYAPELVNDVKAGQRSLVEAYKIASDCKKANEFRENRLVRSVAPDLANPVADDADTLTLVDACAELAQGDNIQHAICDDVGKGKGSVAAASEATKEDPEVQRQVVSGDKREVRRKIAEVKAKRKPQPTQRAAARETALAASTNIRQHSRHVVDGIVSIGEELAQAKTKMPDGSFSPWLQTALGWSDHNAQRFIEVRDLLKNQDTEELGPIDLSVLYIAASLAGDEPAKAMKAPEPGTSAAE